MIVPPQSIGEAAGHEGPLTSLPQREDHELLTLGPANVDQVRQAPVPDQERSALTRLGQAGGVRLGDPSRHLGLSLEGSTNPLAEALGGVIGDRHQHLRQPLASPGRGSVLASSTRRFSRCRL